MDEQLRLFDARLELKRQSARVLMATRNQYMQYRPVLLVSFTHHVVGHGIKPLHAITTSLYGKRAARIFVC